MNMVVGPSLGSGTTKLSSSTIKFLCSYGGKILPRYPDGKLRYLGGETRVLAVDRFISFSELQLKLCELCGTSMSLRCQLPMDDLDALISITCDEDLANLIEEYDRASPSFLKIRAFLLLPKKLSPTSSLSSSASSPPSSGGPSPKSLLDQGHYQIRKPVMKMPLYTYHAYGNPTHTYHIHNGNHS